MILHLLFALSLITTVIWIAAAALDGHLTRTDDRANPFKAPPRSIPNETWAMLDSRRHQIRGELCNRIMLNAQLTLR